MGMFQSLRLSCLSALPLPASSRSHLSDAQYLPYMAVKKHKAKPAPRPLEVMLTQLIAECEGAIREANRVITSSKRVIEDSRELIQQSKTNRRNRASGE